MDTASESPQEPPLGRPLADVGSGSAEWFDPFKGRLGEALAIQIFNPLPRLKAPYETTFPDELWENVDVQGIPFVKAFVSAGANGTPEERWFVRKTLAFLEAAQAKGTRGGEWDRLRVRLQRDAAFKAEATRLLIDSLERYDSVNKAATLGSFLRTYGHQGVEDINRESAFVRTFGEEAVQELDWPDFVAWSRSIEDPPQAPPTRELLERPTLPPSRVVIKREGWFQISAPTLLLTSRDAESGQMGMSAVAISSNRQMLDIFEKEVVRELRALESVVLDELTSTESAHFQAAMEGIRQARGLLAHDPYWARKLASEETARKGFMFSENARRSYMDEVCGLSNYARAVRLCEYPLGNLAGVATPGLLILDELSPSYEQYAADLRGVNRERIRRPLKVKTFTKRDHFEVEGRRVNVARDPQAAPPNPPAPVLWLEARGALCCRALSLIDTMRLGLDFWDRANESGSTPEINRAANDFILRVTNLSVLLAEIRHEPCRYARALDGTRAKVSSAGNAENTRRAEERRQTVRREFERLRRSNQSISTADIKKKLAQKLWLFTGEEGTKTLPIKTIRSYTRGQK